ncbi:F-box-like domain protein [Ceratobasidium sp. AG-Ba]|nr:F-box-like domain protein [Ceratobasidium sp. AG-Ba]
MDIRLSFSKPTQPPSFVSAQLEAIWPHLTSLSSLTLILTSASSCPEWLVKLLEATPTLQTLRLCVFGSSFGPYLRALPQLQNLYLEIHPPDIEGNLTQWIASDEPIHVQRAFYHNWTDLFNDVSEFIDLNTTKGNLRQITWFIYWTMVHSFYSHMTRRNAEPSNVKYINPSNLKSLSRLALTLESQMGTRPFLDAVQGLPLTDLAFTSYGLSLLNGTAFREFCNTFPQLRRLRIKLKTPSHTIGDHTGSIPEGSVNEEEFVKGLASLGYLQAYRGPVLFQRQSAMETFRSANAQGNEAVVKLKRRLQAAGVNPSVMFQWHVWLDGAYGPKEYMTLPAEGPEILGTAVQ